MLLKYFLNDLTFFQVTDGMKSIEFGEFFVRSNSSEGNLGKFTVLHLLNACCLIDPRLKRKD